MRGTLIHWICFIQVVAESIYTEANPVSGDNTKLVYLPNGESMKDYAAKSGFPNTEYQQTVENVILAKTKIKQCVTNDTSVQLSQSEVNKGLLIGDWAVTLIQSKELLQRVHNCDNIFPQKTQPKQRRRKRKVIDLLVYTGNRWVDFPIAYYIDSSSYTAEQAQVIQAAVKQWEAMTCIRFEQAASLAEANTKNQWLLFTDGNGGCSSSVGRVQDARPQVINIAPGGCTGYIGIPVHEIGHALGFFHEQARGDRDDFVNVLIENIISDAANNFVTQQQYMFKNHMDVPYDYGSVMHYSSYDFADGSDPTIVTKELDSQRTMGQRTGLSFFDAKLANAVYCSNSLLILANPCSNSLPRPCERNGYQDPNNCHKCRCLEGFGGTYCDQAADSSPGCSHVSPRTIVDSATEVCLTSPGYPNPGYTEGQTCNWLLQAPTGCTISAYFKGVFDVYCRPVRDRTCFNWVEIKYKNLSLRGPRFCCNDLQKYNSPTTALVSVGNEMSIHFDNPIQVGAGGFQLCYYLTDVSCLSTFPTSPSPKPTTTTTSTRITTTPTTTTTLITTVLPSTTTPTPTTPTTAPATTPQPTTIPTTTTTTTTTTAATTTTATATTGTTTSIGPTTTAGTSPITPDCSDINGTNTDPVLIRAECFTTKVATTAAATTTAATTTTASPTTSQKPDTAPLGYCLKQLEEDKYRNVFPIFMNDTSECGPLTFNNVQCKTTYNAVNYCELLTIEFAVNNCRCIQYELQAIPVCSKYSLTLVGANYASVTRVIPCSP